MFLAGSGFLLLCLGYKTTHAKAFGTIGIQQLKRADFVFSDNASNTRQSKLQLFGLRRRRTEQAALGRAWARGLCGQMNFYNGCARRMRVQIQLQQLEKKFGVEHRQRKAEGAAEMVLPSRTKVLMMTRCVLGEARFFSVMRRVAFAGNSSVLDYIVGFITRSSGVIEFQGEPQFLCGQSTYCQAVAKLFE